MYTGGLDSRKNIEGLIEAFSRLPAAVRRMGLSTVDKLPPLKDWFMAEARGESGDVPRLLQGVPV